MGNDKNTCWFWEAQSVLTISIIVIAAGVHHVFDTSFSRTFSLLESQREFIERFQRKDQDNKALPMLTSACPGNPWKTCMSNVTDKYISVL